jgi:hypothetical protein
MFYKRHQIVMLLAGQDGNMEHALEKCAFVLLLLLVIPVVPKVLHHLVDVRPHFCRDLILRQQTLSYRSSHDKLLIHQVVEAVRFVRRSFVKLVDPMAQFTCADPTHSPLIKSGGQLGQFSCQFAFVGFVHKFPELSFDCFGIACHLETTSHSFCAV